VSVRLVDTTLRDGSHAVAHAYTVADVGAVAQALGAARVPLVEVAHGDGLGGSSFNYGFSAVDELELIAAAREQLPASSELATLVLPGIGTAALLDRAADLGVSTVRVATHCTEADIALEHLALARERGLCAVGFLMMSHMLEPAPLAEQARVLEAGGAQVVYVVDSAGAMVPEQVAARVRALRAALAPATAVGVHAHDNLGLAVGNTLAGVRAGATWADGCLRGLGAGAGNAAIEALAIALARDGAQIGDVDRLALVEAARQAAQRFAPALPALDDGSLLLGYAGVYSSFLLHARRASERYGVPQGDILLELGRRRVVGGQEDMIADVALELAGERER